MKATSSTTRRRTTTAKTEPKPKSKAKPARAKPDPLRDSALAGDAVALEVHADALLEAGDPRGELIRLHTEIDKRPVGDPERIALELREAQLFGQHRGRFAGESSLERSHARFDVDYRGGYPHRIELSAIRWNQIASIARKLGERTPSAERLALAGKIDWARVATLLHALPRIHAFELDSTFERKWLGEPSLFFTTPAADRIDELWVEADYRDDAQLHDLFAAKLPALRKLQVKVWWAAALTEVATSAAAPAISSWKISSARGFDRGDARRLLSANGRRSEPLRDVEMWSHELDDGTLDMLARDLPASYRRVRLDLDAPVRAIMEFLAAPCARELGELGVHPIAGGEPAPIDTPIKNLELHGKAAELGALAAAIRAPRLRKLHVAQYDESPDGMRRVFDSPWLDTVHYLELAGSQPEPWLGAIQRTSSALVTLELADATPATAELLGWSGLANLRVLASRAKLSAEALHRLFANPALNSLVAVKLEAVQGALADIARWPVPPNLRYLDLDVDELGDRDVEALASWPGARQLVALQLGYQPRLFQQAAEVICDRARFPALELFNGTWVRERRAHVAPLLGARFDPWPVSQRNDYFFSAYWDRNASPLD